MSATAKTLRCKRCIRNSSIRTVSSAIALLQISPSMRGKKERESDPVCSKCHKRA